MNPEDMVDEYYNSINEYVLDQSDLGRQFIMEDELYKVLGYDLPAHKPNRKLLIRNGVIDCWELATRDENSLDNVIQFSKYKK